MCEQLRLTYSIAEVVARTGLGRSFICEEIRTERLRSIKIGGRRLILRVDLLKYLAGDAEPNQEREPQEAPPYQPGEPKQPD